MEGADNLVDLAWNEHGAGSEGVGEREVTAVGGQVPGLPGGSESSGIPEGGRRGRRPRLA